MRGVSVVVPCHNSAERLPATLCHLSRQRVPEEIPWEVVVVDNASTDGTAGVAESIWADLRTTGASFRTVAQPVKGLSAARRKGFECARYDYVLFCDDDNWLNDRYVARAFRIMDENPAVGGLGGRGIPHFEEPPPDWFRRYQHYYALGAQGSASGDVSTTRGYVYGAGLVVRKEGWERLHDLGFDFVLSDRRGASLVGGGDEELCFALQLLGYAIWYDESLTFRHFIPAGRMRWDYFLRLVAGIHRGAPSLQAYRDLLAPGDGPPTRELRRRWMRECLTAGRRVLRKYKVAVRSLYRDMEGHPGLVELKRWEGHFKGWVRLRSRYVSDISRLATVRAGVDGREPRLGEGLHTPAGARGSEAPSDSHEASST